VFHSPNNGGGWVRISSGLGANTVNALAVTQDSASATKLLAGTSAGMFRSTDNGTQWNASNTGLPKDTYGNTREVSAIGQSGSDLFAGTSLGGVFRSRDGGSTWVEVNIGLPTNTTGYVDVHCFAANASYLLVGTGAGVFRSTNEGDNWTEANTGLTYKIVYSLVARGTEIFAGTYGGVFRSSDNGSTWNEMGLAPYTIYALAASGADLFAGASGGVFRTTGIGTTWSDVTDGLTNSLVRALRVDAPIVFAGTYGGGVSRRTFTGMTEVGDPPSMPTGFALQQNYPNPFNPSTTIRYALPMRSSVSLVVYNALGQHVAQIIDREIDAGHHEVRLDASTLPSGVYFYRLMAGGYVETRKLLVLR
jgi:hypothetical protein